MVMVLSGNKRALVCNLVFEASNTDIAPTGTKSCNRILFVFAAHGLEYSILIEKGL